MQTCIKAAGTLPAGQIVFFRSFFAIFPIIVFLALKGKLGTAFATKRPLNHIARGVVGVSAMGLKVLRNRPIKATQGDGFTILDDAEVSLVSKSQCKLPIRLRRLVVERQDGEAIILLTNDLKRSAVEIANLYKGRWQIELLFRWIKQHLKIRKFLGNNDNAIRLQLFAAMNSWSVMLRST